MSHQYNEYWFPECILCGMGNLIGVICLDHSCHKKKGLIRIDETASLEFKEHNHAWKSCLFCKSWLLADPESWGSLALCTDCWNLYVEAGRFPPTTTFLVGEEILEGKLEIGWDEKTQSKVRVKT